MMYSIFTETTVFFVLLTLITDISSRSNLDQNEGFYRARAKKAVKQILSVITGKNKMLNPKGVSLLRGSKPNL